MIVYSHNEILGYSNETFPLTAKTLVSMGGIEGCAFSTKAANTLVRDILAEYDTLLRLSAITCFYDEFGSYVGQVVATHVSDDAAQLIAGDVQEITNIDLWQDGVPNWVVWVEARSGLARAVMKSWFAADTRRLLATYINPSRMDKVRRLRRPSGVTADQHRTVSEVRSSLSVRANEVLAVEGVMRLLATAQDRVWSVQEAYSAIMISRALRQYSLDLDVSGRARTFIMWAWLSDKALSRLRACDRAILRASDWNCGRIPTIIAAYGDPEHLPQAIHRFLQNLPAGAEPVRQLRSCESGRANTVELM